MESANLHQHRRDQQNQLHQEQMLSISSAARSSSLTVNTLQPPSSFSRSGTPFSTTDNNAWIPNTDRITLLAGDINYELLSSNTTSSNYTKQQQNGNSDNSVDSSSSSNNTSMNQELGFHETTLNPTTSMHENSHFPWISYFLSKNEREAWQDDDQQLNELGETLLKTSSSACQLDGVFHHQNQVSAGLDHHQFYPNSQYYCSFGSNIDQRENDNFSQISPPRLSPNKCSSSSMGLQTLDLSNPNNFGTQLQENNNINRDLFEIASPSFVLAPPNHHEQESNTHGLSHNDDEISSFMTNGSASPSVRGVTKSTRRSSSCLSEQYHQTKSPSHDQNVASAKKPRIALSRSSFPPLKVRKEKLGDRIASLQQLVAPFGRTDTASVLMEAIGYIKFFQDQAETLSVPYMKSTRHIQCNSAVRAANENGQGNVMKKDLRNRGLCLMPLSCTTYVTNEVDIGGVCSVPNFGGGGM